MASLTLSGHRGDQVELLLPGTPLIIFHTTGALWAKGLVRIGVGASVRGYRRAWVSGLVDS